MVYIVSRTNHSKLCLLNHNLRSKHHSKFTISVARFYRYTNTPFLSSFLFLSLGHRINVISCVYNFINELSDIPQLMYTWPGIKMRSQVASEEGRRKKKHTHKVWEPIGVRARASSFEKRIDWKWKWKRKTKPVFKADSHSLRVLSAMATAMACLRRIWILFHWLCTWNVAVPRSLSLCHASEKSASKLSLLLLLYNNDCH